jgi:type IV pilus assembly protein PilW
MMNKILKRIRISKSEKGFTLVEILVAVAISGVVMAGIYSAYYTQQRSYEVQEQLVAVQQNLRAAMYFMEREIRMAGLDPTRDAGAAIIAALSNDLQFTEDVSDDITDDDDGDGDTRDDPDGIIQTEQENIRYYLEDGKLRRATIKKDPPYDPIVQTLSENIEALDFVYLDADGGVISTPVSAANLANIRSIQIALLGRSAKRDPQYGGTQSFTNMQAEDLGTYTDSYRREILNTQVKCRNIGMD